MAKSIVLRAHDQQAGAILGQRQPHRGRHADADGEHQRATSPIAGHDERERRRRRTARPRGSATGPRIPCARTPLASISSAVLLFAQALIAASPRRARPRSSTGTPASAGRRRRGSARRGPRRPRRRDARRRRAFPPASRLTPTSTTAAPGFTMSAVTMCGTPTAAMMMSACRVRAGRSRVPVWHNVAVAFSERRVSSSPIGRPTVTPRPITTTCAPGDLDVVPPQQVHDAARRTRQRRGLVEHQPAEVGRMQSVGILGRVDPLERRVLVEVLRQRQLHDVAGALGVGVQLVDGRRRASPG